MRTLETLLGPTIKTKLPDRSHTLLIAGMMADEARGTKLLQPYKIREEVVRIAGTPPPGPDVLIQKLSQIAPEMWFSYWCVIAMGVLSLKPAYGTLWAHALITHQRREGTQLTLETWMSEKALMIPEKDEYRRLWEAQKELGAPNSNLLDDPRSYR